MAPAAPAPGGGRLGAGAGAALRRDAAGGVPGALPPDHRVPLPHPPATLPELLLGRVGIRTAGAAPGAGGRGDAALRAHPRPALSGAAAGAGAGVPAVGAGADAGTPVRDRGAVPRRGGGRCRRRGDRGGRGPVARRRPGLPGVPVGVRPPGTRHPVAHPVRLAHLADDRLHCHSDLADPGDHPGRRGRLLRRRGRLDHHAPRRVLHPHSRPLHDPVPAFHPVLRVGPPPGRSSSSPSFCRSWAGPGPRG